MIYKILLHMLGQINYILPKEYQSTIPREKSCNPSEIEQKVETSDVFEDSSHSSETRPSPSPLRTEDFNERVNKLKKVLSDFVDEVGIDTDYQQNMEYLKVRLTQTERSSTQRAEEIQAKLNEPGVEHQAFHEDRWDGDVTCPQCNSMNVRRIKPPTSYSIHEYYYKCLSCGHEFSDSDETAAAASDLPIKTWMLCWYLWGATGSIDYVASKVKIEHDIVEHMIREMKKLFNMEQPLTRFKQFDEWEKNAHHIKQKLQEAIAHKEQLHNIDKAVSSPKDTAEDRRQRERRRDPSNNPRNTPGGRKF